MTQLSKYLATAIAVLALSGCDGKDPIHDDSAGGSVMQFSIPEQIRTAQAVNPQAMGATLETSAGSVSMTRSGDQFEGSIDVRSGTVVTFNLIIYEQIGNQRIIYAIYQGSTNGPVTADTTIPIFESNYTYPDDDSDGATNLAEIIAGSNPANPSSTPDSPGGEVAAGSLGFVQTSAQVEEGEQVQIDVVRAGGSNGIVTATIQASVFSGLTITPERLVWSNGDTRTQTITVTADSNVVPGDTQTVQLTLTSPTGGAILGNSVLDLSVLDITIIPPPPFTARVTDGEWEVCSQPYNTPGPSPFATQLSVNEGRIVKCFKACTEGVILDPVNDGVAWMAAAQHSCFLSDASPGTYANAPVYTPRREQMELNIDTGKLINSNTIWGCDTQNRANLEYEYRVISPALAWYRFNDDGTYEHAITTDNNPPPGLSSTAIWSVSGRSLELGHINTGYRNIVFFPGDEIFHIHPDTDNRIRCTRQSF